MSDVAQSRLTAGRSLYTAGNFAAAERMLKETLAADPDLAIAHSMLSLALFQQGKNRPALEAADAALAILPNAHAFRAKALALRRLKRPKQALAAAEAAVADDPYDELASLTHAFALEETKKPREAEAAFRRAIEIAPGSDGIRAEYGHFLLRQKRLPEAEAEAESIREGSDNAAALLLRGQVALLRRRNEDARDFALWALSQNADDPAALRLLTQVKAGSSRFLGLWWRYCVFLATRTRRQRLFVITPIMVAVWVLLKPVAVLLFLYFMVSMFLFRRMLRAELKSVRLKKGF